MIYSPEFLFIKSHFTPEYSKGNYCVLINYDWRDCKRNFNWPRFTTVDVKALSNHAWKSYQSFNLELQFQMWFLYKSDLQISTAEKHYGIIRIKHFKAVKKRRYSPHQLSEKGFKGVSDIPIFSWWVTWLKLR